MPAESTTFRRRDDPQEMNEMRLDPVKMLLELRDASVRMETKVDIYLGKDGVLPLLQKRMDAMTVRMAVFTGGGMAVMWILTHMDQLAKIR